MNHFLIELIKAYPKLEVIQKDILKTYEILVDTFEKQGKLLIAGNGGSAADAEHICGELMKSFVKKRSLSTDFHKKMKAVDAELADKIFEQLEDALPSIALTGHSALTTAIINDTDGQLAFAQQLYGYGKAEDTFLAITTSGNSKNIIAACVVAKAKGMKVIGLTGNDGGLLKRYTDACIIVPEKETYKIQELHMPIYHALCLMLEDNFFE